MEKQIVNSKGIIHFAGPGTDNFKLISNLNGQLLNPNLFITK